MSQIKPNSWSSDRRGFTLAEALIGLAIFSIVGAALMKLTSDSRNLGTKMNNNMTGHLLTRGIASQVSANPERFPPVTVKNDPQKKAVYVGCFDFQGNPQQNHSGSSDFALILSANASQGILGNCSTQRMGYEAQIYWIVPTGTESGYYQITVLPFLRQDNNTQLDPSFFTMKKDFEAQVHVGGI